MRVIKKAVTVDAWQFPEIDKNETVELASADDHEVPVWVVVAIARGQLVLSVESFHTVVTSSGDMSAGAGDWLMRGVEGELYPCTDSVFRKTYELVPEHVSG